MAMEILIYNMENYRQLIKLPKNAIKLIGDNLKYILNKLQMIHV